MCTTPVLRHTTTRDDDDVLKSKVGIKYSFSLLYNFCCYMYNFIYILIPTQFIFLYVCNKREVL